jgi:hypothetical protein
VATPQTYANHRLRAPVWLAAWFGAVFATGALIWVAFQAPSLQSAALALLGLVVLVGVTQTRTFPLRVQDRVIRLEMQMRLARLGRERDMERLSLSQLLALRFASDAELPALIDRAIAENLTADQIKRAVTDWQGDYLRT